MPHEKEMKNWIMVISSTCLMIVINGCAAGKGPLRASSYFGGMMYSDPERIGLHGYMKGGCNGVLYSCNGGYIDLGHVRESADRVKYVADIISKSIRKDKVHTVFDITEPCNYHVDIIYPKNWSSLSESERKSATHTASVDIAEYIAFKSLVWHEIITWYGWSCISVLSEKPSSFSWEDIYSDALGCRIGAKALKIDGPYERNVDKLLSVELNRLNVLPESVAREATDRIKGRWFSGGPYPFIFMKKRNFDVLDGTTSPWIVPGICDVSDPVSYTTPGFKNTRSSGFVFGVNLEPISSQEKMAARNSMKDGKISPENDFPGIVRMIRSEAVNEAGPDVDKPIL